MSSSLLFFEHFFTSRQIVRSRAELIGKSAHSLRATRAVEERGYWQPGDGGGSLWHVFAGSAADNSMVADGVFCIENTAGNVTFVRGDHGPMDIRKIGMRIGEGQTEAVRTANADAMDRWMGMKYPIWHPGGVVETNRTHQASDGFKGEGSGAFFERRLGYKPDNTKASVFRYTGAAVAAAFLLASGAGYGVQGADFSPDAVTGDTDDFEGLRLVGLTFDGGAAEQTFNCYRAGYNSWVDQCSFTGSTDICVWAHGYAALWGSNYCANVGNRGVVIGENTFDWNSTERTSFDFSAKWMVAYTGQDFGSWTAVNNVLAAPDGTEADGQSPSERRFLVAAAGATGPFVGQENSIAEWSGSAWSFSAPVDGDIVCIMSDADAYQFTGGSWSKDNTHLQTGAGLTNYGTRGGIVEVTPEGCKGFGVIAGCMVNTGPAYVRVRYAEANGAGILIPYNEFCMKPTIDLLFGHPGSTAALADNGIVVRAQDLPGSVFDSEVLKGANRIAGGGPARDEYWLTIKSDAVGAAAATNANAMTIWSNTEKYHYENPERATRFPQFAPRDLVLPGATQLYVDSAAGDDRNLGNDQRPVRTISRAMELAALVDTIRTINVVGAQTTVNFDSVKQAVSIVGDGSATIAQSGVDSDALDVEGKGGRLTFSGFASIGKVRLTDGADVEFSGGIGISADLTSGGSTYALIARDGSRFKMVSGVIDCDGARGIECDDSRIYLGASTLANQKVGETLNLQNGGEVHTAFPKASTSSHGLLNGFSGSGFEGRVFFEDAIWNAENGGFAVLDTWIEAGGNFDATGGTIAGDDTFGVASVSRNAAGDYTVTLDESYVGGSLVVTGNGGTNRLLSGETASATTVTLNRSIASSGLAEDGFVQFLIRAQRA